VGALAHLTSSEHVLKKEKEMIKIDASLPN
jgi:hypothetical protein